MEYVIVLFLVALASAAVAAGSGLWWRRRHRKGGLYARTPDDNRQSIDAALKRLNTQARWEHDHDELVARFDYQSGHFGLRLTKSSPYVRLTFLFFYDTELDNLELVRNVCNQCNMKAENSHVVYSINDDKGVVDLHVMASILFDDVSAYDVLKREMDSAFYWQRMFVLRYNEMRENSRRVLNHDTEKQTAVWNRELFLVREQELMSQEGEDRAPKDFRSPLLLGRLLETAMGLYDMVPARLMLAAGDTITVVDNPDDILSFAVDTPLVAEGQFVRLSAMARLDFYDPRNPVRQRHLTLDFEQEGHTPDTLYYRVTMALVPLSVDRSVSENDREHRRFMVSLLLGHDLTPAAHRTEEFRYVWKEAMAKLENGQMGDLTDDERLLCEMANPTYGTRLLRGKALYEQKRFYEAVLLLENVFQFMQSTQVMGNRGMQHTFYEVCFLVGSCHVHLRQYRTASYYLQLTLPAHRLNYAQMFVNCLVNGHDFRAMNFINSFMHDVEGTIGDDEGDVGEAELHDLLAFQNFLKRRKAFLLVRQEAYDEAEQLLKQLLADPENNHFALDELAYIQRKRGQQPPPKA